MARAKKHEASTTADSPIVGAEVYRSMADFMIYARLYTASGMPVKLIGPYHSELEAAAYAHIDYNIPAYRTNGQSIKIGQHLQDMGDVLTVSVKVGRCWSTIGWAKDRQHAERIRDNHRRHDPYKGREYRIT